jgi:hypothetical protein
MRIGLQAEYEAEEAEELEQNWIKATEFQRKITFLSCWHVNPKQSAAMWNQYSALDKGIAIRTTIEDLTNALHAHDFESNESVGVADVNYIDFDSSLRELDAQSRRKIEDVVGMEGGGLGSVDLFRIKREEFQHEREVRAYVQFHSLMGFDYDIDDVNYPFDLDDPDTDLNVEAVPANNGFNLEVDLDTLIDEIYLSPEISTRVKEAIEIALDRREDIELSSDDVVPSNLYDDPEYL